MAAKVKGMSLMRVAAVGIAAALFVVVFHGTVTASGTIHVQLLPRPGAPNASGEATVKFDGGTLVGKVKARNLPAQAFGSGRFYGVWFVRTDTNDKAFLGALISRRSIILDRGGKGETEFRATRFTDPGGPNVGRAITKGPGGTNLIIVLIENNINGRTPAPVGEAVAGTF
jgi:hypothetical protein